MFEHEEVERATTNDVSKQIDSAFQLTEHLKALHASHSRPEADPDSTIPIDKHTALSLAEPPQGVDRGIWLYELCRFLTQKANAIVVGLFTDDPPCSANTCPEMRASEWQYLCAAHDPPKSCCAIDYCCHTLDWAATQLTSSKLFPSRLALGTENVSSAKDDGDIQTGVSHLRPRLVPAPRRVLASREQDRVIRLFQNGL